MWKNKEFVIECILNSFSKTEVLKKLNLKNNGGNYNTLSSFILDNKIDISHFGTRGSSNRFVSKYLGIEDILIKDSKFKSSNHLKEKLYKLGLKSRLCEICGQSELWLDKKMSLILDHINGERLDNRIENLRIVCPNCNATLDTHCRGTRPRAGKRVYKYKFDKCECGLDKRIESRTCRKCRFPKKDIEVLSKETFRRKRKVERPTYDVLIKQITECGYVAVGRIYGVSDNAVRKWVRMYEKYGMDY